MRVRHLFSKIRYRLLSRVLLLGIVGPGLLLVACSTTGNVARPAAKSTVGQSASARAPFHATLKSSDGKVLIQFVITPDHLGANTFVVELRDANSGKPMTNEQSQIFITMLDMDMGTGVVILQEDGNGRYSAPGNLSMDGNWDMHIQLIDDHAIHVAKLKVYIPA